ncbi:hypothetical protein [Elizabethkingia anophelis]|uniref:Uncharacterized protein n=1 Tax=Elizabethkingia anophelis TaxID=1117645 RepID=A0AAU8VEL3_9FLAO|nr:hypothetical protein [Elizabethkingia anophelis]AQX01475.1 hypothetical protein BBD32_08375 [Elizabethkingia anophelis]OPB62036.1 hypothetical protein BAY11_17025 [Elizabethkingia anophelis]
MEKSKPYWRYQVINHGTEEEPSFAVHEMYFNINSEGDHMWTENAIILDNYDNLEELIGSLEMIQEDIKRYQVLFHTDLDKKAE